MMGWQPTGAACLPLRLLRVTAVARDKAPGVDRRRRDSQRYVCFMAPTQVSMQVGRVLRTSVALIIRLSRVPAPPLISGLDVAPMQAAQRMPTRARSCRGRALSFLRSEYHIDKISVHVPLRCRKRAG